MTKKEILKAVKSNIINNNLDLGNIMYAAEETIKKYKNAEGKYFRNYGDCKYCNLLLNCNNCPLNIKNNSYKSACFQTIADNEIDCTILNPDQYKALRNQFESERIIFHTNVIDICKRLKILKHERTRNTRKSKTKNN
jgi:hypothetical protein